MNNIQDAYSAVKLFSADGVSVIPILKGAKTPIINWKPFTTRLPTDEEIEQWFAGNGANVAAVSGNISRGLIIFDFDGAAWEAIANDFLRTFSLLQGTRKVYTGSGRLHVYCRCPELPKALTRLVRTFSDGQVELRANKHYTLTPPSLHPSGNHYRFVNPDAPVQEISKDQLNQIVAWFKNGDTKHQAESGPSKPAPLLKENHASAQGCLEEALKVSEPGSRNETGFNLAWRLRDLGLPEQDAMVYLTLYAKRVPEGDHPYTRREALTTLRQAYRREAREPVGPSIEEIVRRSEERLSQLIHGNGENTDHESTETTTPDSRKLCGRGTLAILSEASRRTVLVRTFCHRWDCDTCAPRMAKRWKRKIIENFPSGAYYAIIGPGQREAWKKAANRAGTIWYSVWNGRSLTYLCLSKDPVKDSVFTSELDDLLETYLAKEERPMHGKRKITHSQNAGISGSDSAPEQKAGESTTEDKKLVFFLPANLERIVDQVIEAGGDFITSDRDEDSGSLPEDMDFVDLPESIYRVLMARAKGKITAISSIEDPFVLATFLGKF